MHLSARGVTQAAVPMPRVGWELAWSAPYERWFWWQSGTRRTTWSDPGGALLPGALIGRVLMLYAFLYAKCPNYLVLYMQSVLVI